MARLISILNTVAASAADISTSGGYLTINESGSPITPSIRYSYIKKGMSKAVRPSKVGTKSVYKLSFTAANDTTYQFVVTQTVNGVVTTKTGKYVSDASATNAEIGQGLADYFNNTTESTFGQSVQATAYYSGSYAYLHVVGDSGYEVMNATGVSNVTAAKDQAATETVGTTMGNSIGSNLYLPNTVTNVAGTTTVTVSSVAHGLSTGAWVTISNLTAGTLTSNLLNTDLPSNTFRITYATADTFTLDDCTGASLNATTVTVTYVDQLSRGMLADVQADVATLSSGSTTGTASAASYATVDFEYAVEVPATQNGLSSSLSGNKLTLYVSEADADYNEFLIGLGNVMNGAIVNSGTASTTANGELIATA